MANSDFEERDTQVLGISTDSRPTQIAFASSLGNIPYPVLADFHPKGQVSQLDGMDRRGIDLGLNHEELRWVRKRGFGFRHDRHD